ncbi:MAG: DNA repair exonuclease [Deltaproteobacteria bacterium]|jgi:DNA repair exonuclease SbcCD nuclease subunit|nr:DNA repair exonuclease [Deltaproteobacteria bacterium]
MRFYFVHAADLHLDAVLPFATAAGDPAAAGNSLWREAPFQALRRLVDFCIASRASLLLLSGDVYDSRQGSLKARLELRGACQRLGEAGIRVFWARGNHDPLSEDNAFINWPDNLTVFDAAGQSYALDWQNGELGAPRLLAAGAGLAGQGAGKGAGPGTEPSVLVHGISHAGPRESENLALHLRAAIENLCLPDAGGKGGRFSFGVLHCNVGGQSRPQGGSQSGAHENYAPCALTDLTAAPVDYWALGHIHQPGRLAEKPCVTYAGCPQGLHVRESGERGCWLGRVEDGRLAELEFYRLAPLRWERLELDLADLPGFASEAGEDAVTLEELEEFILREIQGFAAGIASAESQLPRNRGRKAGRSENGRSRELALRLVLGGRSALDGLLRKSGNLDDLGARLNQRLREQAEAAPSPARTLIKDIRLNTRPAVDLDEILAGDNLVAETLRRALAVADSPDDGSRARECLALLDVLYTGNKGETWLAELKPGLAELSELAREAGAVCLDLFEVE